jgi:cellobiose PTS system EIIC component
MLKINLEKVSAQISPLIEKIQTSKVANGISGGMMVAMPIIMLGAFAALFLNLPIDVWKNFIAVTGIAYALNLAVTFSTNFLAVVFGATIAGCYAKEHQEDGVIAAMMAIVCFFIITPVSADQGNSSISMKWLGAPGIFSAILISMSSTKIYIWVKRKGFVIKMPATVPSIISESFGSLIPGFVAMFFFLAVATFFAGTSYGTLHQFIYTFIQTPLQDFGGNIVSVIVLWTFAQVLWFFGIHGTLVIYSVILPIFTAMDVAQLAAYAAGTPLPNITGRAFVSTYTMSGSAIGFTLLLLFAAKSQRYKALGKLTAIPSLFGISEPLVFGTPLVFNFRFAIPFILMNAISLVIAYFLTITEIVPRVAGMTPMSGMPIVLSGLMEGSWKIAALQVVLVILSAIVWYPFFRKADYEAYELEKQTEMKNNIEKIVK